MSMAAPSTPGPSRLNKSSSRKRRFQSASEKQISNNTSTLSDIADDEHERSSRQSHSRTSFQSKKYTKEEIVPQLEACMKLYENNKIDTRNVWATNIIDLLSVITTNNTFGENTLKVAASSLEAGTKVYGLRVDNVFTQTLSLAQDLCRNISSQNAIQNEGDNANDVDDAVEGDVGEPAAKKSKKKTRRHVLLGLDDFPTVCEDESKLYADVEQLGEIAYQLPHIRDLHYHLPMDPLLRYKVTDDKLYYLNDDDLKDYNEEEADIIEDFDIDPESLDNEFFPTLREIFFRDENDDTSQASSDTVDIVYDKDGNPVPELDSSIHDPFQENQIGEDSGDEGMPSEIGVAVMEEITDAQLLKSVNDIEYSDLLGSNFSLFSGDRIVKLWAGPSHWKLKCIKNAKSIYTGAVDVASNKRRTKKTKETVDLKFYESMDIEFPTKLLSTKKKNLKKMKKSPYRLPMQIVPDDLRPTDMLRPWVVIELISQLGVPTGEKTANATNQNAYDDGGDAGVDCDAGYDGGGFPMNESHISEVAAPAQAAGHDEDGERFENLGDIIEGDAAQTGAGVNFIEAEDVEKNDLNFAKASKKMDMKVLKRAVWDELTGDNTIHTKDIATSQRSVSSVMHFKDLSVNLPKRIPVKMVEGISPHLTFAALLELVNQKSLMLRGIPTLDDIIITSLNSS